MPQVDRDDASTWACYQPLRWLRLFLTHMADDKEVATRMSLVLAQCRNPHLSVVSYTF